MAEGSYWKSIYYALLSLLVNILSAYSVTETVESQLRLNIPSCLGILAPRKMCKLPNSATEAPESHPISSQIKVLPVRMLKIKLIFAGSSRVSFLCFRKLSSAPVMLYMWPRNSTWDQGYA